MAEETKVAEEVIDGRTALGKRLAALEETQRQILEMLAEQIKRIDECSIKR